MHVLGGASGVAVDEGLAFDAGDAQRRVVVVVGGALGSGLAVTVVDHVAALVVQRVEQPVECA